MKICFYSLRPFDELPFCEAFRKETGIDFVYTSEYPDMENASLARDCDAVSATPCAMSEELMKKFREEGVKYIAQWRSQLCHHVNDDVIKKDGSYSQAL